MGRNPDITVDGRFNNEGMSISIYDENAALVDESWYTWGEIRLMRNEEGSDFTFEIDTEEL